MVFIPEEHYLWDFWIVSPDQWKDSRELYHLYHLQAPRTLRDPKLQVRQIAITALNIHTGQTKGFNPNGAVADRDRAIAVWKRWLAEYEKNL